MLIALTSILLFCCLWGFFQENLLKYNAVVYLLVGMFLILVAALRPIGMDNDSEAYELSYLNYSKVAELGIMEPTYVFICAFLNKFTKNVHWLFFIYAALGVTLKFKAIKQLTPLIFLSLAIYVSNFFILHEFTQIRASIASGLLLLTIKPICEGKKKLAVAIICVAICFHYSASVLLVMLFLGNNDFTAKSKKLWGALIPFGFVLYLLNIGLANLPIPFVADKLEAYQNLKDQGFIDSVNVFNLVYLIKIVIFYYLFYFYDTIRPNSKYFPFLLKMMAISLFSFTAFSALPVLSFRVSELFGVVEIILFPTILYTIKQEKIGKMVVIILALSLFAINVFYNDILHFDI